MTSFHRKFGPGPERVSNLYLNKLIAQIHNNEHVLQASRVPGVVYGCALDFSEYKKLTVGAGAVISAGKFFEFEMPQTFELTGEPEDRNIWIYVDDEGRLDYTSGSPPNGTGWPDHADEPTEAQNSYCVLGYTTVSRSWYKGLDIRRFVRAQPSEGVLTVGDPANGADFATIQNGLDYLAASNRGQRTVGHRLLITRSEELTVPLQIKCNGVILEGVPASPADSDRIVIHAIAAPSAIDVQGHFDVTIDRIQFTYSGEWDADCCIDGPGSRFTLKRCTFGMAGGGSSGFFYAVQFRDLPDTTGPHDNFPPWPLNKIDNVRIEDNAAFLLRRGLINYADEHTCLYQSVISRNYISTPPIDPHSLAEETYTDQQNFYFAIDTGLDAETRHNRYNTVQGNVIENCFNGIRIGVLGKVQDNTILGCTHFGIIATAVGEVEWHAHSYYLEELLNQSGVTELSGNHIELGAGGVFSVEVDGFAISKPIWWRSGIRLEVSNCRVASNTIVVGDHMGSGILHGGELQLEQGIDTSHYLNIANTLAKPISGRQVVSGNRIVMNPLVTTADQTVVIDRVEDVRNGFGIALFSHDNRISDNAIFHAAAGVLVTAGNIVSDNVISPSVVGIWAWAHNTITNNRIGWTPTYQNGLPWYLPSDHDSKNAIVLTFGNQCESNVVLLEKLAGTPQPTSAIGIFNAPLKMMWAKVRWFSVVRMACTDEDNVPLRTPTLCSRLIGQQVRENSVSNNLIDLTKLDGAGHYDTLTGISISGNHEVEESRGPHEITSTVIRGGGVGIDCAVATVSISNCSVYDTLNQCLNIVGRHQPPPGGEPLPQPDDVRVQVVNSVFHRSDVSGGSTINADAANCCFRGCLISMFTQDPPPDTEVFFQGGDHVQVTDCAIVNTGGMGINWPGNFGICRGCWFWTMRNAGGKSETRYPAIYFGTPIIVEKTNRAVSSQGNLVHGLHLAGSKYYSSSQSDQRPIVGAGRNEFPPEPVNSQWNNLICWESCYYLTPQRQ